MNKYCVDTNIIVYTMKGLEPAVDFMKKAQNNEIIFSVIVEAELFSSWKLFFNSAPDYRVKMAENNSQHGSQRDNDDQAKKTKINAAQEQGDDHRQGMKMQTAA